MDQIKDLINDKVRSSAHNKNLTSNTHKERRSTSAFKQKVLELNRSIINISDSPKYPDDFQPFLHQNQKESYEFFLVPESDIVEQDCGFVYVFQCACGLWFFGSGCGSVSHRDIFLNDLRLVCSDNTETETGECAGIHVHLVLQQEVVVPGSLRLLFYCDKGTERTFKYNCRFLYREHTLSLAGEHPYGVIDKEDIEPFTLYIEQELGLPTPSEERLALVTYIENPTSPEQTEHMKWMDGIIKLMNQHYINNPEELIRPNSPQTVARLQQKKLYNDTRKASNKLIYEKHKLRAQVLSYDQGLPPGLEEGEVLTKFSHVERK